MKILRSVLVLGLLFFSFIAFGCEKKASDAPSEPSTSLTKMIFQHGLDLARLKITVDSMSDGSTYVSTEEKGYSIARTQYGSFAVICKNVTPYLDGYNVKLGIGNLTSAQFDGAKISLVWGKDFNNSKDVTVTDTFSPGRYTTVEVVMTPAKPEDIKTFSVTLHFAQMALF